MSSSTLLKCSTYSISDSHERRGGEKWQTNLTPVFHCHHPEPLQLPPAPSFRNTLILTHKKGQDRPLLSATNPSSRAHDRDLPRVLCVCEFTPYCSTGTMQLPYQQPKYGARFATPPGQRGALRMEKTPIHRNQPRSEEKYFVSRLPSLSTTSESRLHTWIVSSSSDLLFTSYCSL
jgi:hypothetical protein